MSDQIPGTEPTQVSLLVDMNPTAHSQPIPIGAGQYMVRKAGMWEPAHADDRCERCVYVNSVR